MQPIPQAAIPHRPSPAASASGPARRACDRCFAGKEKCLFSSGQTQCDRCLRIARPCTSTRPSRRVGRPRLAPLEVRRTTTTTTTTTTNTTTITTTTATASTASTAITAIPTIPRELNPLGDRFVGLTPDEQRITVGFLDHGAFPYLAIIPDTASAVHAEILAGFVQHFDQLKDGWFSAATSQLVARRVPGIVLDLDADTNLRRGARALERFRQTPYPSTTDDFTLWLSLGISILICAGATYGVNPEPVRKYLLEHVRRMADDPTKPDVRAHPLVLILITWDIYDCLLHRQLPIMNIPPVSGGSVDSLLGVSLPLVSHIYDLCRLSYAMRHPSSSSSSSSSSSFPSSSAAREDHAETLAALDRLEQTVEAWQPQPPGGDVNRFTIAQVTRVLTQARVQKMMILLFIHRLKYRFGVQDRFAQRMAHSILSDLDMARITTHQPPRWVTVPFLVAAIEAVAPAEREKVLDDADVYVDTVLPFLPDMTKAFLKGMWEMRDFSDGLIWMDLVPKLPLILGSM